METLRKCAEQQEEELRVLKEKLSATKARSDVLEKTAKDQKAAFQSKMKVLIDKTENDDKLITMLKAEIKKLETSSRTVRTSRRSKT